ncbi:MAG: TetR/AcrR family transcriptional regulator [Actinobacteria bacterium]|nr:TetR/AcrR family transcriptional regulator [Actinomycetota bacterium]
MPDVARLSRDEQRARTRADLLAAAATVFARTGYHASSVDMVAEAAGYTKGAVYSNFASKEDLFLALLDEHVDQAVETLEEIVASTDPAARAQLLGARREEMQVFDRDWHLLETEFVLYAARNERVRALMAERQQRTRARIADLLRRHLGDVGADAPIDLEDLARILIATGDGLTVMSVAEPDTDGGRLMGMVLHLLEQALAR